MEIRHVVNEGFFIFGKNGDELAKLTYRKEGEKLYFESTVVLPELRGQGIAGKLFDAGVEYARENGYKIVPVCSYIVKKFESGKYDDLDDLKA
ncbi:GNAT family N-acetyltransferase [Leptotrichia sp. HSP-536]|uniref:GNAT family N-acetyltransferase n=1 Tax=Leptotrichia alba TaxID=3239304 RepID=A0AB39V6U6_9FUSO